MSTAEELLCSRKWRLLHSLWMLFGWVPFALTTWIGYLIIGVRARNWRWIAIAIAFFVSGCVWFAVLGWIGSQTGTEKGEVSPEPYNTYLNVTVWGSVILWLGNAAGLQWWINRRWLVQRARLAQRSSAPWYATATATGGLPTVIATDSHQIASVISHAVADGSASSQPVTPTSLPDRTTSRPLVPNAASDSVATPRLTTVNINTAGVSDLAALPGMDFAAASQIVIARDQGGYFRDVAELATRAEVKPHVLAGLLSRITVGTTADAVTPPSPRAPTQIRDSGRRLEF